MIEIIGVTILVELSILIYAGIVFPHPRPYLQMRRIEARTIRIPWTILVAAIVVWEWCMS